MVFNNTFRIWLIQIRIAHWAKNILIFIPIVTSHNIFNYGMLYDSFIGFLSLSLLCSATYIINDIKDVEYDKQHPIKKKRPFADGLITKRIAQYTIIILLISSFSLSKLLSQSFLYMLIVYLFCTICYTTYLKSMVIIDTITLSLLYITTEHGSSPSAP